jgi:hypothetical protein
MDGLPEPLAVAMIVLMPNLDPTSRQAAEERALIAPRYLFRWSVAVPYFEPLWPPPGDPSLPQLDESYRLVALGELDGQRQFADVRMAWSDAGLLWTVQVDGKSGRPWCHESRLADSDGLQVWIDTRATTNVHRASKFCHRFVFMPAGGGPRADQPVGDQLLIHRARENAQPVRPRQLKIRASVSADSYQLAALVPAAALGGYDPAQAAPAESIGGSAPRAPRLGFTYAVRDRQWGLQTFATGADFPYEEDPSCWAEVELAGGG